MKSDTTQTRSANESETSNTGKRNSIRGGPDQKSGFRLFPVLLIWIALRILNLRGCLTTSNIRSATFRTDPHLQCHIRRYQLRARLAAFLNRIRHVLPFMCTYFRVRFSCRNLARCLKRHIRFVRTIDIFPVLTRLTLDRLHLRRSINRIISNDRCDAACIAELNYIIVAHRSNIHSITSKNKVTRQIICMVTFILLYFAYIYKRKIVAVR